MIKKSDLFMNNDSKMTSFDHSASFISASAPITTPKVPSQFSPSKVSNIHIIDHYSLDDSVGSVDLNKQDDCIECLNCNLVNLNISLNSIGSTSESSILFEKEREDDNE